MNLYKVEYSHDGINIILNESIILPKNSTCQQILNELIKRHPEYNIENSNYRFHHIYNDNFHSSMNPNQPPSFSYWPLRIDRIPEDQLNLNSNEFLITIKICMLSSMDNEIEKHLFLFKVNENDSILKLKENISKILNIDFELFNKFKFKLKSSTYWSNEKSFNDDDIISNLNEKNLILTIIKGKKKTSNFNNNSIFSNHESSIKIYN